MHDYNATSIIYVIPQSDFEFFLVIYTMSMFIIMMKHGIGIVSK